MTNADGERNWSDDIKDLNLAYVVLAQNLLKADRGAAMLQLGMSDEVADLIISMSLPELARLANSNFVLCAFRLEKLPVPTVLQHAKAAALRAAHISILLASRKAPVPPLALAA